MKSHDLNCACFRDRMRGAFGSFSVKPRKSSRPSSVEPNGGLRREASGSMPDQRARHSVNCLAV